LLELIGLNTGTSTINMAERWATKLRLLWHHYKQSNSLTRARQNAAHHYDLSNELYDLFLDENRQYSCAYFPKPEMTLDAAQEAKMMHIAAKLLVEPKQRILEIGSGWGGLAIYLAKVADAEVTGLTLSSEQYEYSNRLADEVGVSDRVRFLLRDYREEAGKYDRIVSIAMLEAVGLSYLKNYFGKIEGLLTDDGIALVHTISHMDEPYPTNPWHQKYIFPGGYTPALSEIFPTIEKVGLWVTDVEILRKHYAETLRIWRERFVANWDKAADLYDERFCRMWEFYLAACEMTFRHQGHMVAQIQLAKSIDAVPVTRNYIEEWENKHDG
jgi:cyclopropane-fatty-acyl-phospholipid synthase